MHENKQESKRLRLHIYVLGTNVIGVSIVRRTESEVAVQKKYTHNQRKAGSLETEINL